MKLSEYLNKQKLLNPKFKKEFKRLIYIKLDKSYIDKEDIEKVIDNLKEELCMGIHYFGYSYVCDLKSDSVCDDCKKLDKFKKEILK